MLNRIRIQNRARLLRVTTLRGFDGGLNTDDSDLNLAPRFLTRATNIVIGGDGCPQVRQGYQLLSNITNVPVVEVASFNGAIVAICEDGSIYRVNANGTSTVIWNNAIAATLPGSPSGWGQTNFASYDQFNGKLIICNGADKPLEINSNFIVDYLQDPATLTNINVPICRYVVTASRYLCMFGDPLNPNRVHISARDAPGTWFNDPPPNDATFADIGSNLANASVIRGGKAFRGRLLVFFAEGTVVGELGQYDENGDHIPNFNDAIDQYGCISHRAAIAVGDDGLIADFTSISTLRRTVLSQNFKPEPISDLIVDDYIREVAKFNPETAEDRLFAVWDATDGRYMLFVPNNSSLSATTETMAFVLNYSLVERQNRWTKFAGMNFTCGCRTLAGNIIFGDRFGNIWVKGNTLNPITTDNGQPINFEWETPWIDFRDRAAVKSSKYISFDTEGTAEFTCQMYVDRYMDQPACTTEFSGGNQGGFGNGNQPFGGGRNTSYQKLYAWPAKFNIARMRFSGSVSQPIKFVSITLKYHQGGVRR